MRLSSIVWFLPMGAALLAAASVLRSADPIVNAASYGRGIAQGSIFVVIGTNLGSQTPAPPGSFPLRTTLNGTSIRFNPIVGGSPVDAYMIYATSKQLAGLLPSNVPPGDYSVVIRVNGEASAPVQVTVVPGNIGIFTANGSGAGPAQALNRGQLELNRFAAARFGAYTTRPANPGMRVDLYGTGVGPDPSSDITGGSNGNQADARVRVVVGGIEVSAIYAGRSAGTAGLDQIVFTLPDRVPTGCTVPAQVLFGNERKSNTFTLSIVKQGSDICEHRYLPTEALRRLSTGQDITVGLFHLSRQIVFDVAVPLLGVVDVATDFIAGAFGSYGIGDLDEVPVVPPAPGSCIVFQKIARSSELLYGPPATSGLDAGLSVYLNGPNAANLAIARNQFKRYSNTLARKYSRAGQTALGPIGPYALSGFGGFDVGAFDVQTGATPLVNWTNRSQIAQVDRSHDLRLTWTGGTDGVVGAFGVSGTVMASGKDR